MKISDGRLSGKAPLFAAVSKTIAEGDGMVNTANQEQYFVIGANALHHVGTAMRAARLRKTDVRRVLDYACGYGRVLRWLKAEFPDSDLLGVDADPKAAAAAGEAIGVETRPLDTSLSVDLGEPFDVIWVGSLLTHLPKAEGERVMRYLRDHLSRNGVLVMTFHGEFVVHRLANGTKDYNLEPPAVQSVVREYQASGYGYADYPRASGYGISVIRPSIMLGMGETLRLSAAFFQARAWAAHQDVVAFTRSDRE